MSTAIRTFRGDLTDGPKWAIRSPAAFSLVEVAIAMGIVSFCLIILFGLLSVGVNSNKDAIDQTKAHQLLSAVVSDLYATPAATPRGTASTSLQFQIPIPANPVTANTTTTFYFLDNFQTTTDKAQALYALTVVALAPDIAGAAKTATFLDLKVTWPGPASLASAAGTVETFVALNRN